eukprot:NODE_746_length_4600_cov_0.209287.p1 type:complete len:546 gc:universal NODE_746_length_4600_cov_0.209287:4437-2800(-)
MLCVIILLFAKYCDIDTTYTRKSLLDPFLEIKETEELKVFLRECKLKSNFICLMNGEMNNDCLDVHLHYFSLIAYTSNYHGFPLHFMLDSLQSFEITAQYVVVKSILDDDPSLTSKLVPLNTFSTVKWYTVFFDKKLAEYSHMPQWALEFNKLPEKHNLLKYAIQCNSFKMFMMIYYYSSDASRSAIRVDRISTFYHGIAFSTLFGFLRAAQEADSWNIREYFIFYFHKLSTLTVKISYRAISDAIKQFAISHLKQHTFLSFEIIYLLNQENLEYYSTLEELKSMLSRSVLEIYDKHKPLDVSGHSYSSSDLYYNNVDLITSGQWTRDWMSINAVNDYKNVLWKYFGGTQDKYQNAPWQSFRGVAQSRHKPILNGDLILTYCTSSYYFHLVVTSVMSVKHALTHETYLAVLLKMNDIKYTVLALNIINSIGKIDAENIIKSARNEFELELTGNKIFNSHDAKNMLQLTRAYFGVHLTDIINRFKVCEICKKIIDDLRRVAILPCGHIFHRSCAIGLRKDYNPLHRRCLICELEFKHDDVHIADVS